ncbi:MAG: hypothetical protein EOO81_12635 [Oxalobacteraceae bacterium]|nr:MAG: hypothetical protein EOO81_12635 [Oxalobacteraceae bacterium]
MEEFDFGEVPDNRFIMTTWHDKEPLSEALWFSGNCAFHPDIELEETIIVHVAPEEQRATTLKLYDDSQAMVDGS